MKSNAFVRIASDWLYLKLKDCSVNIPSDTDSNSNAKCPSDFCKLLTIENSYKALKKNKEQQLYKNEQHNG